MNTLPENIPTRHADHLRKTAAGNGYKKLTVTDQVIIDRGCKLLCALAADAGEGMTKIAALQVFSAVGRFLIDQKEMKK